MFSKCPLSHAVVRVFVSSLVLVFVYGLVHEHFYLKVWCRGTSNFSFISTELSLDCMAFGILVVDILNTDN